MPARIWASASSQAVQEARALLPDVEAGDVAQAQLVLQEGAAAREVVVGGHGREHHEVDLGRRRPRPPRGPAAAAATPKSEVAWSGLAK